MTSRFPTPPEAPATPRPSAAGDSAYARAIRIVAWINVIWIVGGLFLTVTAPNGFFIGLVLLAPLLIFGAPAVAAGISAGAVVLALIYALIRRRSPHSTGYEFFAGGTMILTLSLLAGPLFFLVGMIS